MSLDEDFITAIEENALILHYQPKVYLSSGKPCGVEALLRWPHKELGMLSPADFIPIIETTSAIEPFTKWLVDTALHQLKEWVNEGINLGISLNYSVRNMDKDFRMVKYLVEKVEELSINPSWIDVEITETLPTTDLTKVAAGAELLRSNGIRVTLDDFCTRFSSLECFLEIPLDIIKIDKIFVESSSHNLKAATVINGLMVMAKELALDVIAEGIETVAQYEMLKELGCTVGQGYFIAKPMAAEAIPLWIDMHQEKLDRGVEGVKNFT